MNTKLLEAMAINVLMWIILLWVLISTQACSVTVQSRWNGHTAVDDREYTQKEPRR